MSTAVETAGPVRDGQSSGSRSRFALGAALLGFFVTTLDALIVSVALPSIGKDLGGGVAGLQWVVDGYTLMLAALLLSAGSISDRIGARRAFGIGLAVFLVASAACGFAPSLPFLVVARFVQGSGAAVMMPATLAMIREAYPEAAARTRALSVWAVGGSVGSAAGPLIGGALAAWDWRWIFFINLPVGALALALLARVAPSPRREVPFDAVGQVSVVLALGGVTYALIEGGQDGFGSPMILAALAEAVVALAVFLAGQARSRHPMMPLDLFRSRPVVAGLAAGLALNFGFYGVTFLFSLYFQSFRGMSALATGLLFLPMTVQTAAVSFASGAATRCFGAKPTMITGQLVMGAGLLVLCLLPTSTPVWLVAVLLMPVSLGGALAVPAMTGLMLAGVPAERAGLASGVLNTFRQFGGALAVAVYGALVGGGAFASGMRTGLIAAAVLLAATAAIGLTGGRRH
ncbi:DHA2 family methylenomycin A resistance protein-like MFS transporter [Streptomyces sp. 846.5]|nr:MFS transporter [Streptomyces sp. 846.5]TDT97905.1 DHA2 family methylenomycin A resistance protein-like MFS transporter [Streptomyces sp. 846.5]